MSSHSLRFTALAIALLAIGSALAAQEAGPGFGPGFGRGQGPMSGQMPGPMHDSFMGGGRGFMGLQLTEAQQAKVKAIHDSHQAALKAKGEAASAAHKALGAALADESADAKTLRTLYDRAAAAQFDLLLEHRAVRQEILPLLTAEQKAQLAKHPMGMMPHRGGHGHGHGGGHEHGGPMGPDGPR
ncbi:MAG: Spy/CpxP family protein refolding chaperone [Acidobacteria bacterium]|nr:Spy/CpxP family protein refolding chaperone [Acidobacteriota bacterium]MBI3489973.1 Spy/CpxP family protein refolding chaperone [Acidobacteriota bacterium]